MSVKTPEEATIQSLTKIEAIRADFPILSQSVNGKPLVYLDNGATTQKPTCVIDRMSRFYCEEYGTVRRGVYALSARATQLYEGVREQIARFINAPSAADIVFTRGTTEAINLVAASYGRMLLKPGDEILISAMEHHANIVPWQQLALQTGAALKVVPITDAGDLAPGAFDSILTEHTKIVALTHVSNALGTVNPVRQLIEKAHAVGAVVLIDGAQAAPHLPIDVQALDCDFYAFSGHKVYGPTGIGVLYGRQALLQAMPPYQCGGDMIYSVTFEKTMFNPPPARFEAGTPAIAEVIGLGEALSYIQGLGLANIAAYEHTLLEAATQKLRDLPGLKIIGTAAHKAAVISFVIDGVHPHDIGTLLDREGIAVRAGHHCAQPLMARFGVSATTRASFSFYNTQAEVDALVAGLQKIIAYFGE